MNEHKGKMNKRPRGSIHKIREFELEKISLVDEFDILQIVGEGWFGKILLVEHRASQTEMVLKAVPKPYVSLRDFYREFHYGLHLGIHRNIVTTYDVAFETAGFYIFTQEYAPLGDLTSNVTDTGVGEVYSKRVAKQIGSALDYMHTKDIVHRDVKLDNVLIYRSDFSRVKLCDFGESFQTGTTVERRNEWLPYSPPEVLDIKPEGTYRADPSHDVWQFGIVIFVCLTGCLPWQKAATDDPRYVRYLTWQGATIIRRTPKLFKLLSSKAQRMFRRFLEPRSDRRPKNLADLSKFIDDRWLAKSAEKEMAEYETDELCPSMYSFHSSPDEKHRLLYSLADCGIETNVDRQTKKNRIKDWIESSVIAEENEEEAEETNSASPSSSVSREPVPGHISSIRATADKAKDIKTTLKDAAQKHFDPRTGALQQGPSEMGVQLGTKSLSPTMSNMSLLNNGDSLAGSLATLGSRHDLIASDLQVYSSDVELHRLGEHEPRRFLDYFRNQSLSSASLLTAPASNNNKGVAAPPNLAAPTPNQQLQPGRSILQRSKSNSLKAALFASSPAIAATGLSYNNNNSNNNPNNNYSSNNNNSNNNPNNNYSSNNNNSNNNPNNNYSGNNNNSSNNNNVNTAFAPNGSQYFGGNNNNNSNNSNNIFSGNLQTKQKTVTFSLANAFDTLARIPLTVNASASPTLQQNKQQQMQQIPQQNKQQQNQLLQQQQQLAWQHQQQQPPQPQTQSPYFNRQQNDSQVKDSAYGSTDSRSDLPMNGLKSPEYQQQSNGSQLMYHGNGNQSQMQRSASLTTNTVRTQSSQQQRMYNGAMTAATMISSAASPNSMKDTAYDRVNPAPNTNARKRR